MASASAQVSPGTWAYPSASGNLVHRLDESGQSIGDFSHCGYRSGNVPLPDVEGRPASAVVWMERAAAAAYLVAFAAEIKTSGLLAGLIEKHGAHGLTIAK